MCSLQIRLPTVGLLQHAAPRAGNGQGSGAIAGVGDLQPAGQDCRPIELGMNFDGDWTNAVFQCHNSFQTSRARHLLFEADPLPVRSQELSVDFQPKGLRLWMFCRVDSAVIETYEACPVPATSDELAFRERFLVDHPTRAVTDRRLWLLDE